MKAYKKILLPLDFSKPCVYAAERARELTETYDAELTLLHIIDYLPPAYVSVELPAELSSKEFLLGKATAHMNEWANENGLKNCKKIVETGQPKKAITKVLKERDFDLVLLAPHADNAFIRFFGSVTNAVAQHTQCDVLILREEL